uniref:Chitin-binding type-2 domain-containing protein n=2 Tax=Steinernema glaseri TaxID=37863 RepID=A0A1I8AWP9_9BILA
MHSLHDTQKSRMILKFVATAALLPLLYASAPTALPVRYDYTHETIHAECVEEGAFVFGCSSDFFVCERNEIGFRKYMFFCPNGHNGRLVMNAENDQCDIPTRVEACSKNATISSTTTKPTKIYRKAPFSCKDKKDGYHAMHDCSEEYAHCSSGYLSVMYCPSAFLYYNSTTGIVSKKKNDPPVIDRNNIQAISHLINVAETKKQTPFEDCAGKQGQLIKEGDCEASFWLCTNSKLVKFNCPEGLFFDDQQSTCTLPSHNAGCPNNTLLVEKANHPKPKPLNINCMEENDGFHEIRQCNPDYFQCFGNHSVVLRCPENMVFNSTSRSCDDVIHCTLDGKHAESEITHQMDVFKREFQEVTSQQTKDPFTCDGKEPGLYALQECHRNFVECNSNETVPSLNSCEAGQVFDSKTCVDADRCIPWVFQLIPIQCYIRFSRHTNFDCRNKNDGVYEEGKCLPYFVHCVAEVALRSKCPGRLVFLKNSCVWPSICKNPPPPPPPTPPTTSAPSTVTADRRTFVLFDCNNLDGHFEEDTCLNTFITCSNNIPHRVKCPGSLRFSKTLGQCTWQKRCLKLERKAKIPIVPKTFSKTEILLKRVVNGLESIGFQWSPEAALQEGEQLQA